MADYSRSRAPAPPLTGRDFARLIAPLGPFEPKPEIAVAVSGGADSMALALLAADWARDNKGRCHALTVDHGLRPESGREAQQVGRWLRARHVSQRILTWTGAKPRTGLQAAARAARYHLLYEWCREHGILHLLIAHTRDDQAETFLLRLERRSGWDGLAGMTAVSEGADLRLIRPLLGVPKARLAATLQARGQDWIEDPSNRNAAFARTRVRRLLSGQGKPVLNAARIAAAADSMGGVRRRLERASAVWLARFAAVYPGGYVELDAKAFAVAPPAVTLRALTRCLMGVSGRPYPPRRDRLLRIYAVLARGALASARTLGGCHLVPAGNKILICAESGRSGIAPVPAQPTDVLWERRFHVTVSGGGKRRGMTLGALGSDGWAEIVQLRPNLRSHAIPLAARLALPALWERGRIAAVPQLGFWGGSAGARGADLRGICWRPPNPLTGAGFSIAKPGPGII